jgi:hypothetical protein
MPAVKTEVIPRATALQSEETLRNRLGVGAAVLATVAVVGSTATMIITILGGLADYTTVPLITYALWFLIAPSLVIVMLCIHEAAPVRLRILSSTSVAFMLVYTVIASFNYFTQLTVMRFQNVYGPIQGLALFNNGNLHSMVWEMEAIEYAFQGVAFLFIASLFKGNRLRNAIRYGLYVNGVNGLVGILFFALDLNWTVGLATFAVWIVFLPIVTALIAIHFRRELAGHHFQSIPR